MQRNQKLHITKYTESSWQKAQLSLGWVDCTASIQRPACDFRSQKMRFSRVTTVP